MSDRTEYKCDHCNKLYSSYKSRWLHIKKYHNNLAGYSVENIPREFTLCPKDNNKALNVLRMHKW